MKADVGSQQDFSFPSQAKMTLIFRAVPADFCDRLHERAWLMANLPNELGTMEQTVHMQIKCLF